MEDPSRLVVVTQEGTIRILDWIDQALLYNYSSHDADYRDFTRLGIRTGYDLYRITRTMGFLTEILGEDGTIDYSVSTLPTGAFGTIDPARVRNIVIGITCHPNFQKIKRMRERAASVAQELFTLVKPGPAIAPEMAAPKAAARKPKKEEQVRIAEEELARSWPAPIAAPEGKAQYAESVLVVRSGDARHASATAICVGDRSAITVLDVVKGGPSLVLTAPVASGWGPLIEGQVKATLEPLRLALVELNESPGCRPARVAETDAPIGGLLHKYSPINGYAAALVDSVDNTVLVHAGEPAPVELSGLMKLRMSAEGGDSGSPLFTETGELAGVLVAGGAGISLAAPASRLRVWLENSGVDVNTSVGEPSPKRVC